MKTKTTFAIFALLAALIIPLAACGGQAPSDDSAKVAGIVSLTMTAMAAAPALQTEAAPAPTMEVVSGDLHPLADDCSALKAAMEPALRLAVSAGIVPVETSWSGETGQACQLTASGNGNNFQTILEPLEILKAMLQSNAWLENSSLSPCLGYGGAGPTANMDCFVQENKTCETFAALEPVDASLCPSDRPIGECLATLAPEQKLYTIRLTCAEGKASMPLPKTEPIRIQFAAGATSTRLQGRLQPGGLQSYVLAAMAGQTMTADLNPAGAGILAIWGADGTTLMAASQQASGWNGILPATQDYYIDIISVSPAQFDYILDINIPAPGQTSPTGIVYPSEKPFPRETMQTLRNSGVPLVLPPVFPVEAGLPAVVPYPIYTAAGAYAFSLDYGEECLGAGACHYGVIIGERTTSPVPTGLDMFPFDGANAEQIMLAKGITGYFVDYTCGANCGDAMLWWVHGGYQYAIGLKAGARETLIELVNAAIHNSIP